MYIGNVIFDHNALKKLYLITMRANIIADIRVVAVCCLPVARASGSPSPLASQLSLVDLEPNQALLS